MVPWEPIIQGITWAPVLLQMAAQWWPLPILAYPLEAIDGWCPNNLQMMMVSQNCLLPLDLMWSMLNAEPIHPCHPIPTPVPTLQMVVLLEIIVIHLSLPCLLTFLICHHIITHILVCIQDQVAQQIFITLVKSPLEHCTLPLDHLMHWVIPFSCSISSLFCSVLFFWWSVDWFQFGWFVCVVCCVLHGCFFISLFDSPFSPMLSFPTMWVVVLARFLPSQRHLPLFCAFFYTVCYNNCSSTLKIESRFLYISRVLSDLCKISLWNLSCNHQFKIELIEPIVLLIIRVPSRNDWGYFKIEMISITSIDPSRFADVCVCVCVCVWSHLLPCGCVIQQQCSSPTGTWGT